MARSSTHAAAKAGGRRQLTLDSAPDCPSSEPGSADAGSAPKARTRRIVRNGVATNDLVLSAYVDGNEALFPRILRLYVAPGSTVADVTYGKGVFWRNIPDDVYNLLATDLQMGIDCRELPYEDGEIDCVVFDPPYMHTPGGTAHSTQRPFERYYRNNDTGNRTKAKYHEAVLALYEDGGMEAHRVLRPRGVMIVKCQDEVCSNRQRFTHVEIIQAYEELGFVAEDLFVVVRTNRPGVSRAVRQVHARKNHSYFLVFWKRDRPGGNRRRCGRSRNFPAGCSRKSSDPTRPASDARHRQARAGRRRPRSECEGGASRRHRSRGRSGRSGVYLQRHLRELDVPRHAWSRSREGAASFSGARRAGESSD